MYYLYGPETLQSDKNSHLYVHHMYCMQVIFDASIHAKSTKTESTIQWRRIMKTMQSA